MLPLLVFAAYSRRSACADFSLLLPYLRWHLLPCALCIFPHLSDMYPLGTLLYIPCSFNVLPQNLICCLDSFREHHHVQSFFFLFFLHLNIDANPATKRVLSCCLTAGSDLFLCKVGEFSPCRLWVSSGCRDFHSQNENLHAVEGEFQTPHIQQVYIYSVVLTCVSNKQPVKGVALSLTQSVPGHVPSLFKPQTGSIHSSQ